MVLLIAIPFLVLVIVIFSFSVMRGVRRVHELQMNQPPLTLPRGRRKPSDDYHDQVWLPLCKKVADAASSRLSRPLTATERRQIWRSRTSLVLEILLKEIQEAATPQEVWSLLATLPPGMDRPDPSAWCRTA